MNYKQALSDLNLVYPDGISKGFPLWTKDGLELQKKTTDELLQLFEKDFEIHLNYATKVTTLTEYSNQYKNRIEKYDDTLPIFKLGSDEHVLITDSLPYNLKRMEKENLSFLLTYYSVIRLLDVKQIPMSRDYYISPLLQVNLSIQNQDETQAISFVLDKINQFFHHINIPIVILEYDGVEGYSNKVYMVGALNYKNELQTILQCSLLSKELLQTFELSEEMQNKLVFDIGYSQKLFAYLADNNLDKYGMRFPSAYQKKEIAVIYRNNIKANFLSEVLGREKWMDLTLFISELGEKKLKTIKNELVKKGIRTMLVHQIDNEKEWFDLYTIDKEKQKIETIEELEDIMRNTAKRLDDFYYHQKDKKLQEIRQKGFGYVSEFKQKGKVILNDEK